MSGQGIGRWWVYQRERFPLVAHGVLILAFSSCAVTFSASLRGATAWPSWRVFAVAFVSAFLAFLHLRLADEFKDFADDARWRPYRPVQRGLVTLRELGVLWVVTALIQLAAALWLNPWLVGLLALTWLYLGLMSHEFFCRDWLKKRPFTYLWSHMLIMPLIDFYATACDWLTVGGGPPAGLGWFVVVSFLNGFVIEIGRKIRAPEDEEDGVETYSRLWGRSRAVGAWGLALALTGGCAMVAAQQINFARPTALVLGLLALAAVTVARGFLRVPRAGKRFETLSGLWTLGLYAMLGLVPFVVGRWP
jgi:4-hydroxybenzoate polyprenyltransferase